MHVLALFMEAFILIVESSMANLSVRKLDDQIYDRLRIRAAEHGVSMEE